MTLAGAEAADPVRSERQGEAGRLLTRLVTACDVLASELRDEGHAEIAALLTFAGRQAFEASRHVTQLGAGGTEVGPLAQYHREITTSLGQVQQAATQAGINALGEDLLSLELTAWQFGQLLQGQGEGESSAGGTALAQNGNRPRILVADDDEGNREILLRLLSAEPWELHTVASGVELLAELAASPFQLVLLDVLMPGMDGLEVLRRLHAQPAFAAVPVVMLSGVGEVESVVACLRLGARDYIAKPFNPVLLRARIRAVLEHQALVTSARERATELEALLSELHATRLAQEQLITSILPSRAVTELRQYGSARPAYHNDVTVLFTDFCGFTASCFELTAYELVSTLDDYFSAFDSIVDTYGLERLKTVGDAYLCTGGLSSSSSSHPIDAVLAAFEMLRFVRDRSPALPRWEMRIGINTGPVVSGIVGTQRLAFDIWGDTVNLGARVVGAGVEGRINLSENTYLRVKEFFTCERREPVALKGKPHAQMYLVSGVSPPLTSVFGAPLEEAFRARYGAYFGSNLKAFPPSLASSGAEPFR